MPQQPAKPQISLSLFLVWSKTLLYTCIYVLSDSSSWIFKFYSHSKSHKLYILSDSMPNESVVGWQSHCCNIHVFEFLISFWWKTILQCLPILDEFFRHMYCNIPFSTWGMSYNVIFKCFQLSWAWTFFLTSGPYVKLIWMNNSLCTWPTASILQGPVVPSIISLTRLVSGWFTICFRKLTIKNIYLFCWK